jgi:hypothetical protein
VRRIIARSAFLTVRASIAFPERSKRIDEFFGGGFVRRLETNLPARLYWAAPDGPVDIHKAFPEEPSEFIEAVEVERI